MEPRTIPDHEGEGCEHWGIFKFVSCSYAYVDLEFLNESFRRLTFSMHFPAYLQRFH